jgi:hypothetical protein
LASEDYLDNEQEFQSLVNHLFVKYPMPRFFYNLWFDNRVSDEEFVLMFQVALGINFRKCYKIPNTKITKKIVHHMMEAPKNNTVYEALRYGQIIDMGGNYQLSHCVNGTSLVREFENEEFWIGFLKYLIKYPELHGHIQEIIDYINEVKFNTPAIKPNLSLKGKKPANLLKEIDEWHTTLKYIPREFNSWSKNENISGFLCEVDNDEEEQVWVIRELTNSQELYEESRDMVHCVASYESRCITGMISIWNLSLIKNGNADKIATIEVQNHNKSVVQIKGKHNSLPKENEMSIIYNWIESQNLSDDSFNIEIPDI